jgi:hypothetical protein
MTKTTDRFDFYEDDFPGGQHQLEIRGISAQLGTIGVMKGYGLFTMPILLRDQSRALRIMLTLTA